MKTAIALAIALTSLLAACGDLPTDTPDAAAAPAPEVEKVQRAYLVGGCDPNQDPNCPPCPSPENPVCPACGAYQPIYPTFPQEALAAGWYSCGHCADQRVPNPGELMLFDDNWGEGWCIMTYGPVNWSDFRSLAWGGYWNDRVRMVRWGGPGSYPGTNRIDFYQHIGYGGTNEHFWSWNSPMHLTVWPLNGQASSMKVGFYP